MLLKLTPVFLNVGTPNVLLVKQSLAAMEIAEAATYRRSLKKAKSKKSRQNPPKLDLQFVGYS